MAGTAAMVGRTREMLVLQDEMNRHVDPGWRGAGRAWHRAIWIECAELMEHHGGWKWWKHATPDLAQAVLEIVDIWHFGLSLRLVTGAGIDAVAAGIVEDWETAPPAQDFLADVETLARAALAEQRFAVAPVRHLLAACGGGFDDLYRNYVAKHVLNVFRQDHGYRDGTYRKIWHGREDNAVLVELLPALDVDGGDFRGAVYAALAERYAASARG
jgi:hypothetical protein